MASFENTMEKKEEAVISSLLEPSAILQERRHHAAKFSEFQTIIYYNNAQNYKIALCRLFIVHVK